MVCKQDQTTQQIRKCSVVWQHSFIWRWKMCSGLQTPYINNQSLYIYMNGLHCCPTAWEEEPWQNQGWLGCLGSWRCGAWRNLADPKERGVWDMCKVRIFGWAKWSSTRGSGFPLDWSVVLGRSLCCWHPESWGGFADLGWKPTALCYLP